MSEWRDPDTGKTLTETVRDHHPIPMLADRFARRWCGCGRGE